MDTFNEIAYKPLRDYNRSVMAFNIRDDGGIDAAKEYLAQFSHKDRLAMLDVYNEVKKIGPEEFKRRLIRDMPLQEEAAE